jgi:hypothetical protein
MSDAAPCTNTLVNNQHVITKVYFPRLVLPLTAGCSPLIDFCIGLTVMIVLTLSLGIRPAPTVLLLPVLFFFAVFTALAVGLWTSALNALYRDFTSIARDVEARDCAEAASAGRGLRNNDYRALALAARNLQAAFPTHGCHALACLIRITTRFEGREAMN